jgi:hypothetical protein
MERAKKQNKCTKKDRRKSGHKKRRSIKKAQTKAEKMTGRNEHTNKQLIKDEEKKRTDEIKTHHTRRMTGRN